MIPILFNKDEKTFTSLGLGQMDATLVEVERERNGNYTLYAEVPFNSPQAKHLTKEMLIKADAGSRTKWQTFKINRTIKDTNADVIKVYADHISMDTINDAMKPKVVIRQQTAEGALRQWANSLVSGKAYDVQSDITHVGSTEWTIDEVENARQALGGVQGSILDVWGGEYEFDNNRIILHKEMGRTAPTVLEYGRNIVSLEYEELIDGVYTSIYPYATYTPKSEDNKQLPDVMVTLDELIVDSEYAGNYETRRIQIVDFSNEFDSNAENPEIPTQTKLRTLAKAYVKNNYYGIPKISQEIDFVDLSKTLDYQDIQVMEEIELNDRVPVYYPNIDAETNDVKVTTTNWDVLNNRYSKITISTIGAMNSNSITSKLSTAIKDLKAEQKKINNTVPYLINAQGNRVWHTTPDENMEHKIDDTWFKKNGKYTIILRWNGSMWEEVLNDETFITEIEAEVSTAKGEADKAVQSANDAVEQIDTAVANAGFTSLDETLNSVQSISNTAQTNAQTALSQSLDALGDASTALTNSKTSLGRADTAISSASSALTKAKDAQDAATVLSGQVSDFEITVGGFTQTVNNYEGQVSGFRSDISGLDSTVANYASEVDKFGNTVSTYATEVSTMRNTVSGFESTVGNYKTELLGYRGDVTQYKNQLSTMTNTVNGFNNTVAQYTTEVGEYGKEVNSYATKVSTLENTVNGFNSTVSDFQYDLDNLEIGGRNLLPNTDFSKSENLSKWELRDRTASATPYKIGTYNLALVSVTSYEIGDSARIYSSYGAPLEYNQEYTLSFIGISSSWFDDSFNGLRTRAGDGDFKRLPIPTKELIGTVLYLNGTRYIYKYTLNFKYAYESSNNVRLLIGSTMPTGTGGGNWFFVGDIKIEKGNKATDWSPAPEDMATATQVSTLSNTVDGFKSAVDKVEADYKGVSGTVANHTSSISNLNGQIALKANTTTVNALTGRVSTAETGISSNSKAIKLKASQSSVDTLAGTVNTLGSEIDVVAGKISSKVWNTDIESAIDGIEVGGRNLIRRQNEIKNVLIDANGNDVASNVDNKAYYSISIESGKTYMISRSRTSYPNPYIRIAEYRNDNSFRGRVTINSETYKYEPQEAVSYIRISYPNDVDIKMEVGNVATDWTPAPEDTDAKINHVESSLDVEVGRINALNTRVGSNETFINDLSLTPEGFWVRTARYDNATQRIKAIATLEQTVGGLQSEVYNADGSSSITQLATGVNSLVTSVSKLEENGRNLIRRQNELKNILISADGSDVASNVDNKAYYSIPVETGKSYMVSRSKTSYPSPFIRIAEYRNDGSFRRRLTATTETYKYVPEEAVSYIRISYPNDVDIKMEMGDRVTPYSPAPEDTATTSQVSQLADNINLRVSKDELLSQINVQAGGVLIQSGTNKLNVTPTTTYIENGTIKSAMIESLEAGKIKTGTLDAGKVKVINIDAENITANQANLVKAGLKGSSGGTLELSGDQLLSTASDGSQVYLQNGVVGVRRPPKEGGGSIGQIGYVYDGGSPTYTIQTSWGSHFALKQRFYDSYTKLTKDKRAMYVSTGDDGVTTMQFYAKDFVLQGDRNLRFGYDHYINGIGNDLTLTGQASVTVRAKETTVFVVSSNGKNNYASMYANLNMQGNTVTNTSDIRLKRNIVNDEIDSLSALMKWQHAGFNYINPNMNQERQFSVIAQSAPDIAFTGEDGYLQVSLNKQVNMTSHALQQHVIKTNDKVEQLEAKIASLQEELALLKGD